MRPCPSAPRLSTPAGLALPAIAVAAFGLFALDLARHGPLTSAGPAIASWFHRHMRSAVTRLLLAIIHSHSTFGVCAMAAIARACLGVHYLSDVLAAVAEGVAWLALGFTLLGALHGRAHAFGTNGHA